MHQAQSDIKIHSTVSYGLDFDHEAGKCLFLMLLCPYVVEYY